MTHVSGTYRLGLGGEGGIRTHGGREPTAVFKTAALNHSATSPGRPRFSEAFEFFARSFDQPSLNQLIANIPDKLCTGRDEPSWPPRGFGL